MKKIIFLIFCLFLITGCDNLMNTPTKRVEKLLSNYQTLNEEVLNQLEEVITKDTSLNEELQKEYKSIMEKQYKDLKYTIKNETIDGNISVVEVEIEVYDYNKAQKDAEKYLVEYSQEFTLENGDVDSIKYNAYKMNLMKNTKERITYTINFTLSKIEEEWLVDDLTENERSKIHGLYAS